jgi:hypothetical protein
MLKISGRDRILDRFGPDFQRGIPARCAQAQLRKRVATLECEPLLQTLGEEPPSILAPSFGLCRLARSRCQLLKRGKMIRCLPETSRAPDDNAAKPLRQADISAIGPSIAAADILHFGFK